MSDWVDVEAVGAIESGSCKVVDIDDVMVAVFNIDGEFYAIEDLCSHDGGEIATGCLLDDVIECPRHGARFNVKTGEVLSAPAYEDIDIFEVRIKDNTVQVRDSRWD
ncbi:MAG: 3-phenylpropionate/trans-cinnamate dioxygenase ferredoxin subunit [Parasphingorhabdus sp.]|jgi:3-phenylpropionate/trans-cinnamate dioxygenase ferredoxin subunit